MNALTSKNTFQLRIFEFEKSKEKEILNEFRQLQLTIENSSISKTIEAKGNFFTFYFEDRILIFFLLSLKEENRFYDFLECATNAIDEKNREIRCEKLIDINSVKDVGIQSPGTSLSRLVKLLPESKKELHLWSNFLNEHSQQASLSIQREGVEKEIWFEFTLQGDTYLFAYMKKGADNLLSEPNLETLQVDVVHKSFKNYWDRTFNGACTNILEFDTRLKKPIISTSIPL